MGIAGLEHRGIIRIGAIVWIYCVKSLKGKRAKRWKADVPVLYCVDLFYLTRDPLVN